jgi:hypothetical protein
MKISSRLTGSKPLSIFLRATLFFTILFVLSIITSSGVPPGNPDTEAESHVAKIADTNGSALYNNIDSESPVLGSESELPPPMLLGNTTQPTPNPNDTLDTSASITTTVPKSDSEAAEDNHKALQLRYQKRRIRELSVRKKVENVGVFVGCFVVGIGGWWWAAEMLRSVIV